MKEYDTSTVKVFSTKDYEKFDLFNFNRKIDKNHVKRLKGTLDNEDALKSAPILVTPDLSVIDGQHRLQAAKELDLEVYYIIDYDFTPDKLVNLNNVHKKWTLNDYLNYWENRGSVNYLEIRNLMEKYDMPLNCLLEWHGTDYSMNARKFKCGLYKFNSTNFNEENINFVKEVASIMKEKSNNSCEFFKQRFFHTSFNRFLEQCDIDKDLFIKNTKMINDNFIGLGAPKVFLKKLLEIYNLYRRSGRLDLVGGNRSLKIINLDYV